MSSSQSILKGLMVDEQLNIKNIMEFAEKFNPNQEIVTRTIEGPIHRYTMKESAVRQRKVSQALKDLGIKVSDRVGTIAMNTYRHFELYYGISCYGAVLNTINPRLHPEQLTYIVNHANDILLFIDLPFLPIIEKLWNTFKCIKKVIILTDSAHMPKESPLQEYLLCYEDLIAKYDGVYKWPELDEYAASSLCYTSGTTGNPKGVLYSHRSTLIHTYRIAGGFTAGLNGESTLLPVVPMFHANAWGLVYCAPICGFKLVLPGIKMDGASIYELISQEQVVVSFGVPTVWNMLLKYCAENGKKMTSLKGTYIGGSAVPQSLIKGFWTDHDCVVYQGWGMTEMSPLGTLTQLTPEIQKLPLSERQAYSGKAGKAVFGCDMKIIDENGKELPHDGEQQGELIVRGPSIASAYFNDDKKDVFLKDGWFMTGDIAKIDQNGWLTITDRSKDVIKSGGEWVSSLDLEDAAMGHPNVYEAAVIGVYHPKWDERPLLIVNKKNKDKELTKEDLKQFLVNKVAKFWLPDDIVIVDKELPKQATGKIWKRVLREDYKDYKLPTY
ncbi:hypothetical protein PPERSA_06987 [Pseudocohnilembus persalinus]|uniref:AMP-dependent synthetase/ligase domain-containing protein n=1 Tax=Pseudocohnilembus persalinus TaxID=266149 RepID=A0A0V0QYE7_PSEPJ|nr:hypothetical protein PPERSA_06987 [Pseudocohnilembus persalinus]|eukprot:KRX07372.1 hypothetical protein PPERSA_06987 [Pseudocohnilembus persalinus]